MRSYKLKNLFGICAIPGCHHFATRVFVIERNKKRQVILTCLDCSFEIYKNQNAINY